MRQSIPYSKDRIDSKVSLLLIPSIILLIYIYKKVDKWANNLESYSNPYDIQLEIPKVNNAIHEELLENPEEREYNPSAMASEVKNTLMSVARTFKGKQD
jgi:hypothetical protein